MQNKISIIVPVYNVEPYLNRCLESIINQTYRNLEIILIDDGSTDNSGLICDKYKEDDDRIIVIHKENGGLPSARNKGMDIATGDFITFVDSDDYILKDMYEYLINIYNQTGAEIVCCGVSRIYKKKNRCFNTVEFKGIRIYDSEKALCKFQLSDDIGVAAWNKLFQAQIVRHMRFEDFKRLEDSRFVCKAILAASKVAFGCEHKYMYEIRNNSVTQSGFNEKNYDILKVSDLNYHDFIFRYPNNKNAAVGNILWYTVFINEMIIRRGSDCKMVEKLQLMIKENWSSLSECNELSFIRKGQYFLLGNNFTLYKAFYKAYCIFAGK